MGQTLTVELNEADMRRLQRVAEISRRPMAEIVSASLRATLPPLLEEVPADMRDSLGALEVLGNDELRGVLGERLSPERLARYDELLARNASAALASSERRELADARRAADRVMFRKAYAAVLLKWRGQRVPAPTDLDADA